MITEKDLLEAIAERQGTRNPNANTCIKLAAYYTILKHMQAEEAPVYSYSPTPFTTSTNEYIGYKGESEFSQKIYGADAQKVLGIIDELMDTLSVLNPSLYNSVMRKLSEI